MINTPSKKHYYLASVVLPLTLLIPNQTVLAQTNAGQNASSADEVVVTGSRIRRSNINTAIPMQGLDLEALEQSGSVDLGEILTQIPGVEYSLSPEGTSLSTQNSGLSTINLRGLGGDRTLVLINGRRAVSNSGNGERVSTDTIPSGFIARTEVTTGGASAIYGADAIAGVANILLRKDFEGVRASARIGTADASGETETTLDLTIGRNFDQGRGNFMIGGSWDKETAAFADDTRPETIAPLSYLKDGVDCTVSGSRQCGTNFSSVLPGGRFEGDDAWNVGGVWYNDKSLAPDDGRTPSVGFETGLDGYNFRPGRTLSPEVETFNIAATMNYELTPSVTAFGEIYFTQSDVETVNAPRTASSGTDIGPAGNSIDIGSMSSSHPFIPDEVQETRSGSVSWSRRFSEVGNDIKTNDRQTIRSVFGLDGDLDNGWQWNAYATYGTFDQEQNRINGLDYQNIRNALRVEDDGAGGYQCSDADARADGCVPLNLFGEGSITAEMADYIRYDGVIYQERSQTTFGGGANGDLYELPAGMLKGAFGVEYRKESQETIGDPDFTQELTSMSVIPSIEADFDVMEAYGELDIPLVTDKPGIYDLNMQLAARVGDYSTVGTIFSYNVGGSYSPTSDIRFRAQYSRSQRAPTITEFYSDKRGDFDDLNDPCNGLLVDGTGLDADDPNSAAFATNCLANAGIQAFFADPDNAGLAFDGDDTVFGPNAGNTSLQEETADTFTIGTVITPSSVPELSFIVDYYRIEIDGAIDSISTQDTVDLCYASDSFPSNRFCDVVTRDASTGDVIEVINREENLNSTLVEGIDISLNYELELSNTIPGQFDLGLIYSHVFSNETEFETLNGTETDDDNGEIGSPKDRFRAKLGWKNNAVSLAYTWHYYGSAVDDVSIEEADDDYFKINSQSYHDIYAAYDFDNKYGAKIFAGVKNIANDLGPVIPTNLDHGSSRNVVSSHNRPIGREFYTGIRFNW